MKNKKGLSEREKLFCRYYAQDPDAEQSAINAGYVRHPDKTGERLLLRSDIVDEIARLIHSRQRLNAELCTVGYKKLAFGSIADAISLMFKDNPTQKELSKMDLYLISEIKKPKDGAMEIKFFDRLKALEKLSVHEQNDKKDAGGLIDALYTSADRLSVIEDDSDEV